MSAHELHEDAATGGTALLVHRAAFVNEVHIATEVLHGGRAVAVTISVGDLELTVIALHHCGTSVAAVNAMSQRIREMVDDAQRDPLHKLAVLFGDFNYDVPEEVPWRSTGARSASRPGPASLRGVAAAMTELHQPNATRCEMANGVVLSCINRVYVSAPGWLLVAMIAGVRIMHDPNILHKRGLSDHSPVVA